MCLTQKVGHNLEMGPSGPRLRTGCRFKVTKALLVCLATFDAKFQKNQVGREKSTGLENAID